MKPWGQGHGKAVMRQRIAALARAVSLSKEGKLGNVPSFVPEWRPHGEGLSHAVGGIELLFEWKIAA